MRIALIGPARPDQGGGAQHTTELANRLAAAGHNVIIESWRPQHPEPPAPGTPDEGRPYPRTYRRLAWYRPDGWLAAGRRLRSADLVVFAVLTPAQVPAYLSVLTGLSLGRGRPRTVVICHAALPPDAPLTRTLLSRADTVIVHSAAQAAQARALAPDVPIVIARIPPHLPARPAAPALWPERSVDLAPAHPRTRLLFFGVVRPGKGLDILLRALAQTPDHVTLTVAGEFRDDPAETRQLIAALGLGTRVTLRPGYVPAGQLPALFAAADALVLPYREAAGSQNVQLAFSFGVPVVATTAGALAEAVRDGVDGLTCAPADIDDLARALNHLALPETARRLRAGVRPVDPEPYWSAYLRAVLSGSISLKVGDPATR